MKQWFKKLTRREQLIVALVVTLLSVLLVYAMAWAPLRSAVDRYESANEKAQESLEWMRSATADIQRGNAGASQAAPGQSISSLVDSTLPDYKLVMQRYQPTGDDSAQVWLEDAALPQVIAWVVAMERDFGMRMVNVSIAASDKKGVVKTRVRLARP